MGQKDKANEVKIPPAVIRQLEEAIENAVGDFKATFKGEFIQLSDRVDELAEQFGDGKRGESRLLLAQKMYKTDRKEILEVSTIPSMASEPFAYALALDDKTSRRGQNKDVSLTALTIDYILRLNLSVLGRNRWRTLPALIEQVSAMESGEGRMQEIEAGGK
jgi:hypothetical protein